MRDTVSEAASPAIRELIEEYYVPWFSNVDQGFDQWYYISGSYSLPLICIIDPEDQYNYINRTTSYQAPATYYSRLESTAEDFFYVPIPTLSRWAGMLFAVMLGSLALRAYRFL